MRLEEEIKLKEFKSSQEKGIINLIYTYNWVESQLKVFFKSYGLTNQQYNILRILRGQNPKPCTINLLRERMLDKMSDASRIVERLRIKGLLERTVSPTDRRSVDITISQKGLELLAEVDETIPNFQYRLFQNLDQAEIDHMNLLLDKFRG